MSNRMSNKLSKYLVQIGANIDRNIRCIITEMNEPIGRYFGNSLEIQEIIDCLHGKMTNDMADKNARKSIILMIISLVLLATAIFILIKLK